MAGFALSTADNRLPIDPPPDYDPKDYELVARFIAACQENGDDMDLRWFSKHDPLPNRKWDFNTATFGGNLPGASWEWPEATYDRRVEIAKEIENYHRGLLHFLATDPRVPEKVKNDVARFGLPHDEFTDNGGWPHQIYVREGRRMISDLVLTEHHTFGRKIAPHSIGLGSYGTDIHEIRRIVKDGVVIREGKVAGGRRVRSVSDRLRRHRSRNGPSASISLRRSPFPPAIRPSPASAWNRYSWSRANPRHRRRVSRLMTTWRFKMSIAKS
ncbi:MAG: FAD-dependent oxidoreductase [Pirellulaceae bacterium]